jgi:hypothetical protein
MPEWVLKLSGQKISIYTSFAVELASFILNNLPQIT